MLYIEENHSDGFRKLDNLFWQSHAIDMIAKDVEKKLDIMQASVEKVEKALYGLTVRGAERPKGWMPDVSDAGAAVAAEV